MEKLLDYIHSGILELYALGGLSDAEKKEVDFMVEKHPEVKTALNECVQSLEHYSQSIALTPSKSIKASILATVDFKQRIKDGELFTPVPRLSLNSRISDFDSWLQRPDLQLPEDADEIFSKVIGYTPEVTTMVVWIKNGTPPETHTNELESFFILEGSCYIHVEKDLYALSSGMYFQIPLFKSHFVEVTSEIPCKVILERRVA